MVKGVAEDRGFVKIDFRFIRRCPGGFKESHMMLNTSVIFKVYDRPHHYSSRVFLS
jgi:hypothetical protein